MDFGKKEHRIGVPLYPSGNLKQDMARLRLFFKDVQGKIPERS
ncbi:MULTISPECIES: hypothetical protein [Leeuwenhoekiella]|jgi:hypothetical protein|uniref:Uncharacterized protein n=1 Tax=Leeuwenhoekiella blandensis (strain CECT 7118 / CCUG 51940 / KCTC 22103 / MED217) TaxID=398720 RepID=A3XN62_LEEBM|nr:hypothetical protein [Leeuwenhoekiella blandensis]EAQ49006.1 hypothetical protein MED217_10667 [Leeuwenhoekiella blandensis MED217]|tara:strand:- start:3753 stop:3881 length:129 start_codon:yes stop_codon:yes gene_type:complete